MSIAVAIRYARALADVVGRAGNYRQIQSALDEFRAAYRASSELRELFETPAVSLAEKLKVLNVILERLGSSPPTSNFLRVLVSHYRINLLEEVIQAFNQVANERLGIVQVKVFSGAELSETERQALRDRFAELTRKHVEAEFHLDERLMGGVMARIASTVYDGSVRGRLERFRQELVAPHG